MKSLRGDRLFRFEQLRAQAELQSPPRDFIGALQRQSIVRH